MPSVVVGHPLQNSLHLSRFCAYYNVWQDSSHPFYLVLIHQIEIQLPNRCWLWLAIKHSCDAESNAGILWSFSHKCAGTPIGSNLKGRQYLKLADCQGCCLLGWLILQQAGGMGASSSCMQVAPEHVDPAFRRLRPIGVRSRRGCRIRRRARPVWRCLQTLRFNVVRKLWPHAAGEHSSHLSRFLHPSLSFHSNQELIHC